jgi:hypothetical protein
MSHNSTGSISVKTKLCGLLQKAIYFGSEKALSLANFFGISPTASLDRYA